MRSPAIARACPTSVPARCCSAKHASNTSAATQRVPGSRLHHFDSSVLKRRKPQAVGMFALARQSSTVWGVCWCNFQILLTWPTCMPTRWGSRGANQLVATSATGQGLPNAAVLGASHVEGFCNRGAAFSFFLGCSKAKKNAVSFCAFVFVFT